MARPAHTVGRAPRGHIWALGSWSAWAGTDTLSRVPVSAAPSVQPPAPPHWLHKHFQHLTAHPQTWNQGLGRGLTDAARARWHTAARGGSRCPCSHASLGCPPRTPAPLSRAGPHRASAAGDGSCAHATRGWSSWPGRAPLRHLGSDPAGGRLSLPAFHLNPCKRAATGPVALRLGSPGFRPSAAGWGAVSCDSTAWCRATPRACHLGTGRNVLAGTTWTPELQVGAFRCT